MSRRADAERAAHYEVAANPEFLGFESVQVTEYDEAKPWRPAKTLEVVGADGSKAEGVDANAMAFTLKDVEGNEIEVSIGTAGHIDALHIKGEDLGSKFDEPDFESLMRDAAARLPDGLATRKGIFTLDVDMGKGMGMEGIASLDELVRDGVLTEEDVALARSYKAEIQRLNLEGDSKALQSFVAKFAEEHPDAKVGFKLIRDDRAIVPAVVSPKRPTTKLFVMMGPHPTKSDRVSLYTLAPGRDMPRHPIRGQHTSVDGKDFNAESFQQSAEAWFETAMLTGK